MPRFDAELPRARLAARRRAPPSSRLPAEHRAEQEAEELDDGDILDRRLRWYGRDERGDSQRSVGRGCGRHRQGG